MLKDLNLGTPEHPREQSSRESQLVKENNETEIKVDKRYDLSS